MSARITRGGLEGVKHRFFGDTRGQATWVAKTELTLALPDLSNAAPEWQAGSLG